MKRRTTYYVLNLLFPVIALTLTASLVFALPADAGEKMGTSITVLLAYAVYLSIISDSMPKTSLQTSWLGVYLTLLFTSTGLAVVFSTIVIRIHFIPDHVKVGTTLRNFVISTRRALLLSELPTDDTDNPDEGKNRYFTSQAFISQANSVSGGSTPNRNNKIGPGGRSSTAFTLADSLSMGGESEDTLEEPGEPPKTIKYVVTWQNVAESVDRIFFYCFTAYNVGCTAICLLYLEFGGP